MNGNLSSGNLWVFYKCYLGPKTADEFLKFCMKALVLKLTTDNIISAWFFIRYTDPEFHLRIRFKLKDSSKKSQLDHDFNNAILPWLKEDRIWKTRTDIYVRETERYGKHNMELSEELFNHDSNAVLEYLNIIHVTEDENYRWLFAVRLIKGIIDDFNLDINDQEKLISGLKDAYHSEFGMNRLFKRQLDRKYRMYKDQLENTIKGNEAFINKISAIEKIRSNNIQTVAKKIDKLYIKGMIEIPLDRLLASYIHMTMNRVFRTRLRLHELVVYDFLSRFLISEIAKNKNRNVLITGTNPGACRRQSGFGTSATSPGP